MMRLERQKRWWLAVLIPMVYATGSVWADGVYLWRDPAHYGVAIGTAEELGFLMSFCQDTATSTIYYDVFGDGSSSSETGLQDDNALQSTISELHASDISVYAVVTESSQIPDITSYNARVGGDASFDAIVLVPLAIYPSGYTEPSKIKDIEYYEDAVDDAGNLPLHAVISYHWDTRVKYNNIRKPAYQHIIDLSSGVIVQSDSDSATTSRDRTKEEVCYAESVFKHSILYVETADVNRMYGSSTSSTYYDEGESTMTESISAISYAGKCTNGTSALLDGHAFNQYRESYNSGAYTGWPCHGDDNCFSVPPEVIPDGGATDFDVDTIGNLVSAFINYDGSVYAECFNTNKASVGTILVDGPIATSAYRHALSAVMSDEADRVLISWRDYPVEGVYSRLLTKDCVAVTDTFNSIDSQYGEFNDVVFDNDGNFVVAENDNNTTRIAWFNSNGTLVAQDQFSASGSGTHLAMNEDTGEGILLVQTSHSGDVISYRRWSSPGVWMDSNLVHVPVGYAYWYDGATVGMNDNSEFVVEWRDDEHAMNAAFYDASGNLTQVVTYSTLVRPSESYYHDPYRRRHAPVVDHCNDFILAEVYSSVGDPEDAYSTHYRYTADGDFVESMTTFDTWPEGLSHRMDGLGYSYFGNGGSIAIEVGFTPCN